MYGALSAEYSAVRQDRASRVHLHELLLLIHNLRPTTRTGGRQGRGIAVVRF